MQDLPNAVLPFVQEAYSKFVWLCCRILRDQHLGTTRAPLWSHCAPHSLRWVCAPNETNNYSALHNGIAHSFTAVTLKSDFPRQPIACNAGMRIETEHTSKQAASDLSLHLCKQLQTRKLTSICSWQPMCSCMHFAAIPTCMQLQSALSCQLKSSLGCMWTK